MANQKVENELVVIYNGRLLGKEVWKMKLYFVFSIIINTKSLYLPVKGNKGYFIRLFQTF